MTATRVPPGPGEVPGRIVPSGPGHIDYEGEHLSADVHLDMDAVSGFGTDTVAVLHLGVLNAEDPGNGVEAVAIELTAGDILALIADLTARLIKIDNSRRKSTPEY